MRWITVTAGNDEEQKLTFDEFKTDPTLDQLTKVVVPAGLYTKPELAEILSISYKRLSHGGRVVLIKPKWFTKTPTVGTEGENPLQKFLRVKAEWSSEQISQSFTLRLLKINGFLRLVETDELIVGQKDEDPFSNALPLVTIAIPAYKSDFFEHSLLSAMGQSYPKKTILVADEGVDPGVFEIYKTLTEQFPHIQVKYVRHERPLGEVGNFEFCRALAHGKYLKYLNDDDILDPQCVERFVRYMEAFDDSVTLIASRRN
ncbi:MAG: glycosyltransferase, partial [Thermoplasmatales archaeon]